MTFSHVTLNEKHNTVNLGKIQIVPSARMMEEVQVTAQRTMVEYQLDKRVVNVDKNLVTSGGTATDVLESVPSVSVDNDGNVSLRGSSSVKVLINGRPYEMMGNDLETLLEQREVGLRQTAIRCERCRTRMVPPLRVKSA